MQLIQENQAEFLRLVNEPAEAAEGYGISISWCQYLSSGICVLWLMFLVSSTSSLLDQFAAAGMPQTVAVTPEENEAIQRVSKLIQLCACIHISYVCISLWCKVHGRMGSPCLLLAVTSFAFCVIAAWTNGLWPRSGSGGFRCLQQGWASSGQLFVGPHERVWWWSSIIGWHLITVVYDGRRCRWNPLDSDCNVFWRLIVPF